jgi:hypothetical protein
MEDGYKVAIVSLPPHKFARSASWYWWLEKLKYTRLDGLQWHCVHTSFFLYRSKVERWHSHDDTISLLSFLEKVYLKWDKIQSANSIKYFTKCCAFRKHCCVVALYYFMKQIAYGVLWAWQFVSQLWFHTKQEGWTIWRYCRKNIFAWCSELSSGMYCRVK